MRWFLVAATICCTSGCVLSSQWHDVPGALVHVETSVSYIHDERHDAAWRGMVEGSIATWRAALPEECAEPFVLSDGPTNHPIRLVAVADWRSGSHAGIQSGDFIEVREDSAVRLVLLHELGHALGLEHTDSDSVMVSSGSIPPAPTARDGRLAACLLSCGPC